MDDRKPGDAMPPDDLPPEPPKASSVLGNILARARAETEAETGRLLADLKAREDADRASRQEDEFRKRDEAKARVEEERKRRVHQIEEYEQRKRDEAEAVVRAAAAAAAPKAAPVVVVPPKKSSAPLFVTLGVLILGGGGFAGWWFSVPHGEPVAFVADRTVDQARAGAFQSAPLPFGPATEAVANPPRPDQVVTMRTPAPWAPAPVEPKHEGGSRRGGRTTKAEDTGLHINIQDHPLTASPGGAMPGTDVRVVLVTAPAEAAPGLARALVEARVAACVNVVPGLSSVYRWEGRVCEEPESLLVLKTAADRVDDLMERVRALHPYACPEIVVLPVLAGAAPYLAWVVNETRP
jgi:periplasmic divalent cation tolerance protein